MRIALIGQGAIARYVSNAIGRRDGWTHVGTVARRDLPGTVRAVADLPPADLLVDCAGHSGLAEHAPGALAAGLPVLTLSLGALADTGLAEELRAAAQAGNTRLSLASGAIGALDALRAARAGGLERVVYTGRKPPQGWRGSPAEDVLDLDALTAPTPHFEGTAREAALRYPKNANVAAAVALAGAGFDATKARLIADPDAPGNVHEIRADGAFGQFEFRITGASLPDNPRSSAMAAMSAIAALEQADSKIGFL